MTGLRSTTRKVRIVCISDTHNAAPGGPFKLPKGDVLIHAGDMTNQGSFAELERTVRWIEEADFQAKIVVAGNHDITLDTNFYARHGESFHNQRPQDPVECQGLLENSPSILWLKHEAATVSLAFPDGLGVRFKIFGSPFSPVDGMWAFGYESDEASKTWDQIPLDSDIVITHTPPMHHLDEKKDIPAAGCEALRTALWRVRPRLAVCGHVHSGRGAKRICWDLGDSNIKYKEASAECWTDPGFNNKKMSLVDLSAKGGSPVQNDGSKGDGNSCGKGSGLSNFGPMVPLPADTRGQGGVPPSALCDLEALSGRMGRQETCIVNAAITATLWANRSGGKKFNKPIVVDIDLPTWEE
ncbi:uncharacterized protein BP5553_01086 [Venustampulla echinocandica]|uniref:Calcineurin-like phosphoesterase domain-containing protein n=1 Tax=Venustampulla echinocandica TaxID=2656787 RepID=A0A370U018_9HELO|nr:uncharacterized protein BP5553_01086 [Venustampulla echinocandica]RDL41107.1 hypothetical protein BP5553_01086 [Venustampulla echinocandica]